MQTFSLYTEREIKVEPARKHVKLDYYPGEKNAPAVLILPGGAYSMISDFNEGKPFAERFQALGYHAFVLHYRVGFAARYPAPLQDVARALQFVKSRAEQFGLLKDKIALVGSSAGGHLAAFFAAIYSRFEKTYNGAEYSLKPSVLVLCYPVITMGELTHKVSRKRLLGILTGKADREAASVERLVTSDYPPVFVWHNKDDGSVDYHNTELLCDALEKNGVRFEKHLYETGGHGIGLAEGKDAEGWFEKAAAFLQGVFA